MVERREHKRYPMPRGTFIIIRNELDSLRNHTKMSIGEIAMVLYKSKSEVMGQVTNMSWGGIAFDGNLSGLPDIDKPELDLLMAEKGIYLHNIPYETLALDPTRKGKNKSQKLRTNAVRFKKLDSGQALQLRELLANHVGPPQDRSLLWKSTQEGKCHMPENDGRSWAGRPLLS